VKMVAESMLLEEGNDADTHVLSVGDLLSGGTIGLSISVSVAVCLSPSWSHQPSA
jgi:hypothetical protein